MPLIPRVSLYAGGSNSPKSNEAVLGASLQATSPKQPLGWTSHEARLLRLGMQRLARAVVKP